MILSLPYLKMNVNKEFLYSFLFKFIQKNAKLKKLLKKYLKKTNFVIYNSLYNTYIEEKITVLLYKCGERCVKRIYV